jgi:hypothetical protein
LKNLQARIPTAFDEQNPEHREHLRRLWTVGFPNIPFPNSGIADDTWKLMGWQSNSPARDFRGGGFLALELLVHFATQHTQKFLSLMQKERQPRNEFDYPFAAASVVLTYELVGKFSSIVKVLFLCGNEALLGLV